VGLRLRSSGSRPMFKIPGRKGQTHNETSMRVFRPHYKILKNYHSGWLDKYRDGWGLLEKVT
jgi:hypothetical protein